MKESNDKQHDLELPGLLAALFDDSITDEQFARLDALLLASPEARQMYFDFLQIHGDLPVVAMRMMVEDGRISSRTLPPHGSEARKRSASATASSSRRLVGWMKSRWTSKLPSSKAVVFGLTMLVLGAVSTFVLRPYFRHVETVPFATLTRANDCVWDAKTQPETGARFTAGSLTLTKGLAEIELANGVQLLIEAPTTFDLIDTGRSVLSKGRIVARVPSTGIGYTIDTSKTRIVDLGTEFGVSVDPNRETIVEVFVGVVEANLKNPKASGEKTRRLVAGEAIRVDDSQADQFQTVSFSIERFLRTFSTPSSYEGEELIPFRPSQLSSLNVIRAKHPPTIDGDLADWDLSGEFKASCDKPFTDAYHVRGNMMYDDQYLYIAARVGDPMPMRSIIDPGTNPVLGWMGGSIELRLSTDSKMGWPLQGQLPLLRKGTVNPQDTSERLAHLTLWYYEPRSEPCLMVMQGMNLANRVVNPPGWKGVFRKAADGKSYTLEYAIPWSLLGAASDPPKAGEVCGVCWIANWSDATGKNWKGQLIEIKNPAYFNIRGNKKMTFQFAETWGKAIYLPATGKESTEEK